MLHGSDSSGCCKYSSETLVHVNMIPSYSWSRLVSYIATMKTSHFTMHQWCSKDRIHAFVLFTPNSDSTIETCQSSKHFAILQCHFLLVCENYSLSFLFLLTGVIFCWWPYWPGKIPADQQFLKPSHLNHLSSSFSCSVWTSAGGRHSFSTELGRNDVSRRLINL